MDSKRDTVYHNQLRRPAGNGRAVGLAATAIVCAGLSMMAVAGATNAQSGPARTRIAVVKSLDLPQYNSAYDGFIKALTSAGHDPAPTILTLPSDGDAAGSLRDLVESRPDLILALGTRAARDVSALEKTIPIIYSMVLSAPSSDNQAPELPSQSNLTGASLNIPLNVQLDHIRTLFPTAKKVGIISDPSRTKSVVDSAISIAKHDRIEICVQWVHNESDIPNAVRALTDSIDVLWMIPDQTVITPRSSRFIIFELIKAGVPILGLSSAYVKAGAVVALDCDYEDVGRQSGELAVRILAGQSPSTLSETYPRVFTLALNGKVREHLRLELDEAAIQKMHVIMF